MSHEPNTDAVLHYRVTLGHNTVVVAGRNESDAIRAARLRLSDDMPRLWDVITTLEDNRFQVAVSD